MVGEPVTETQLGLEIDGIVGPFWLEYARFGVVSREEDDSLEDIIHSAYWGSEANTHYVCAIGDALGDLWRFDTPSSVFVSDRAPTRDPYKLIRTEY